MMEVNIINSEQTATHATVFAVPRDCLRFVIVVFPDHTHLLFLTLLERKISTSTYVLKTKIIFNLLSLTADL